ncbi:GNAT family N-acetyltransferase [Haloimpatiens sp. FM7330]|uniref:GNAT family N-acetyltransferase n=1 Tax=Haloimpatiens sp. FM7330 TaxID=3298610 RepID=UPI0036333637
MYKCVKLTMEDIDNFRELNKINDNFNVLNKNFFDKYDNENMIKKIFLTKQVNVLKNKDAYIGYVWASKIEKSKIYNLNSLNIIEDYKFNIHLYRQLINSIDKKYILKYTCEKNYYNYYILNSLGFKQIEGTIELFRDINNLIMYRIPSNVEFRSFVCSKDEELRCKVQNDIFYNKDRIPLTVRDVWYDEQQNYFYEKGCYFMKVDNKYVGYGQIIFEDSMPYIVNFGIIKEYRNAGYGKNLLEYLINSLYNIGFKKVFIKVDCTNYIALNLYAKLGFVFNKEICKWQLEK